MSIQTERSGVLVTGGAGGIGSSIVSELLKKNYSILVADSNPASLYTTKVSFPDVQVVKTDLSRVEDTERLAQICLDSAISNIVHCAGYGGPFDTTENTTYDTWRKVFSINVDSLFILCKNMLPELKKERYGRIVAISSIQGQLGSGGSSAYVSSKHALNGLIKTIATEYGPFGITANAIAPGYISSPMGANDTAVDDYTRRVLERTPTQSQGTSSQVASLVGTLLDPSMGYMNGSILAIDGGISASVGVL